MELLIIVDDGPTNGGGVHDRQREASWELERHGQY